MEILWIFVLTVFALWGLSEFIRTLALFICGKTAPKDTGVLIIPIKGSCEQAEYILRSAAQQVRFNKNNLVKKIVCVLISPDGQTEKICRAVCGEYSYMEIEEREAMPDSLM